MRQAEGLGQHPVGVPLGNVPGVLAQAVRLIQVTGVDGLGGLLQRFLGIRLGLSELRYPVQDRSRLTEHVLQSFLARPDGRFHALYGVRQRLLVILFGIALIGQRQKFFGLRGGGLHLLYLGKQGCSFLYLGLRRLATPGRLPGLLLQLLGQLKLLHVIIGQLDSS
ncbi:hypothetical protein DSECCO2_584910 [anaerobic digester metagenome]